MQKKLTKSSYRSNLFEEFAPLLPIFAIIVYLVFGMALLILVIQRQAPPEGMLWLLLFAASAQLTFMFIFTPAKKLYTSETVVHMSLPLVKFVFAIHFLFVHNTGGFIEGVLYGFVVVVLSHVIKRVSKKNYLQKKDELKKKK